MADSTVQSFRDIIDDRLANSGPEVRQKVIEHFVDEEQNRRAVILRSGVVAIREAEADHHKVNRGDVIHYDASGTALPAVFTKDRLAQIKKASDRINGLNFALTRALSDHATPDDFAKLEKLVKSKGEPPKGEAE